MAAGTVTTLHVWGVPARSVPSAVAHLAVDRGPLRRQPGLAFAKLLGTGAGRSFGPGDADPRHWAVLATWDSTRAAAAFESSRVVRGWDRRSEERLRVELRPLSSRGRWSGREPFVAPAGTSAGGTVTGPVAALTRARLRPSLARTFWRAVPPVAAELHGSPGLQLALGIGEAPVGLQGTFSVWSSAADLTRFAYRQPEHQAVVRRTHETGWYAEELFARFAVLTVDGTYRQRPVSPGSPA